MNNLPPGVTQESLDSQIMTDEEIEKELQENIEHTEWLVGLFSSKVDELQENIEKAQQSLDRIKELI